MSRNRALLSVGVVAVVLIAVLWFTRRGREAPPVIDLLEKFPTADLRPVGAGKDVFDVRDEKIAGDTRRAIYAYPPTRITWHVTLPNDGWLRTAIGIDEQAWDKEGDGVLFLVGISANGQFTVLLEQRLDPHANRADRRWVPVLLDLSRYSGQKVDIIFNTRVSAGKGNDARNDFAYWGSPAISLRP